MLDSPPSFRDGRFVCDGAAKRGGMGTVWKARDAHTGRPVAVKILNAGAPELAERFVREATYLADITDDRIVGYVAHGTTADGAPYLAMEWLEGETLAERMQRRALALSESLAVVTGAARGLAAAHRRGLVHR